MFSLQQLRSFRIFGIAIFDLVASLIAVNLVLSLLLKRLDYQLIIFGSIITIPLGIVIHYIFGINTKLNELLKLNS